ncbi:conserved hypothetical protein [Ricinus communis]|uniref:Uncharacterized protein n=1 Tax=Ricinus communis TaxID=3988 RepID=B9T6U6_RICCO|nr:conserved hypothetical protein [Ricinus communis]
MGDTALISEESLEEFYPEGAAELCGIEPSEVTWLEETQPPENFVVQRGREKECPVCCSGSSRKLSLKGPTTGLTLHRKLLERTQQYPVASEEYITTQQSGILKTVNLKRNGLQFGSLFGVTQL